MDSALRFHLYFLVYWLLVHVVMYPSSLRHFSTVCSDIRYPTCERIVASSLAVVSSLPCISASIISLTVMPHDINARILFQVHSDRTGIFVGMCVRTYVGRSIHLYSQRLQSVSAITDAYAYVGTVYIFSNGVRTACSRCTESVRIHTNCCISFTLYQMDILYT